MESTSTIDNTENLWVQLDAAKDYLLQVIPKVEQPSFQWDYALAWRMVDLIDTDNDGIPDNQDNCTLVINADQLDTNGDGYGNICDGDFNNNGLVDPFDFSAIKSFLGQPGHPDEDINGNGIIDPADFSFLKANLGQPPGPSCCAP